MWMLVSSLFLIGIMYAMFCVDEKNERNKVKKWLAIDKSWLQGKFFHFHFFFFTFYVYSLSVVHTFFFIFAFCYHKRNKLESEWYKKRMRLKLRQEELESNRINSVDITHFPLHHAVSHNLCIFFSILLCYHSTFPHLNRKIYSFK